MQSADSGGIINTIVCKKYSSEFMVASVTLTLVRQINGECTFTDYGRPNQFHHFCYIHAQSHIIGHA